MKKLFVLTFVISLLFSSCGNKQAKNETSNEGSVEAIEKSVDKNDLKKARNCEEFLENYEEWIDDYLKMIEKYMKNPLDQTLMTEYTQQAGKAMNWYSDWGLMDCATKEKYEKRFDAINDKLDKKLKELELD